MPNKPTYPPSFSQQQPRAQPHPPQVSQTSSLENLMNEYMAKEYAVIQSQAASLRNLEIQMGDTKNPRRDGKKHCKAVTLRSGKNLESNEEKSKRKNEPTSVQTSVEKKERVGTSNMSNSDPEANVTTFSQQNSPEKLNSKPPPPFPQQFQKQQQYGKFWRFLDVLKQLYINILLVEALE
ncbi:uncharacterized protein LOC133813252 [Humulus lupulus]|uniref:uncharacterized protein LOC133813252 n=1 Tax=Humulus lupulus TaxID=3486 RepID=UPI002B4099CC|nr:uncharacterized protein LOC133813252 [Humulus lupulus]